MPINPHSPEHALYTITHEAEIGVTVQCNCRQTFNAPTEERALALFADPAIHGPEREVLELAAREAVTKHPDIGTAVRDTVTYHLGGPAADIEELPAQMTNWTSEQFAQWLLAPGTIYVVYLPRGKSFIVKVPDQHAGFFTGMMQQLRIQLGPEVQAMSAAPVALPPQPPYERIPDGILPPDVETVPQRPHVPHVPNGPNIRTVELPDDPTPLIPGPVAGRCEGSGKPPKPGTERNREYDPVYGALRNPGRGACSGCSGDYRLTNDGNIWSHRSTK